MRSGDLDIALPKMYFVIKFRIPGSTVIRVTLDGISPLFCLRTQKISSADIREKPLPDFSLNMTSNRGGGVIQTIFEEYNTESDI